MAKPLALIIRTAGTNCDRELASALELAGATTQTVHLNQLIQDPSLLERVHLIALPGGFSYGDDIAAGRILANRLRCHLLDPMKAAVARGVPLIGICNGFQVLVKLGLLPDPRSDGFGQAQTVTLAGNTVGKFITRWVSLEVPEGTACVWTRGITGPFELPIAHGEGRFVPVSDQVLDQLRQKNQIAIRYGGSANRPGGDLGATTGNPNGSVDDIAGICDPSGLVLGLMPHPERFTHFTHHPLWTSLGAGVCSDDGPIGLRLFRNAVEYVNQSVIMKAPAGSGVSA